MKRSIGWSLKCLGVDRNQWMSLSGEIAIKLCQRNTKSDVCDLVFEF